MKKIFLLLLLISCEENDFSRLELYDGLAIGTTASVTMYATLYNSGKAPATELIVRYTLKTDTDSLWFIEQRNDTVYPKSYIGLTHLFECRTKNFKGNISVLKWKDL